jgi:hypothetical protein
MLKMVLDAQLLAHRRHVLHGRMVVGREHEADAALLDAARDLLGRQVDVDAQRLQHVGAARLARHAAPAVLAHLGARCGRHEHRAGRDVEGVRAVAAGADDVHQVRLVFTGTLVDTSRITCAAAVISPMVSFFTRRPVISAAIITGEQLAAHDEAHDVQHLVVEDLAVLDGALQRFLGGDHGGSPRE